MIALVLLWTSVFFLFWLVFHTAFALFASSSSMFSWAFRNPEFREIAMSVPFALAQALVIMMWMKRGWLWMLATILGWTLGWIIVLFADATVSFASALLQAADGGLSSSFAGLPWWAAALVVGLVLGTAQHFTLRQATSLAWAWIPVTAFTLAVVRGSARSIWFLSLLGPLLTDVAPLPIAPSLPLGDIAPQAIISAVEGLLIGLVSAIAFGLLVASARNRHSIPQSHHRLLETVNDSRT